jgi:hypothetical protein
VRVAFNIRRDRNSFVVDRTSWDTSDKRRVKRRQQEHGRIMAFAGLDNSASLRLGARNGAQKCEAGVSDMR